MWSFKSCHDPERGNPETNILYFPDPLGSKLRLRPPPPLIYQYLIQGKANQISSTTNEMKTWKILSYSLHCDCLSHLSDIQRAVYIHHNRIHVACQWHSRHHPVRHFAQ